MVKEFGLCFEKGEPIRCERCHSFRLKKRDTYYGKYKISNVYKCRDCDFTFRYKDNVGKIHFPIEIVTEVISLNKFSSRKIEKKIKHKFRYSPHRNTICEWLRKFNKQRYINQNERLELIKSEIPKHKGKIVAAWWLRKLFNYSDGSDIDHTNLIKKGFVKKIGHNKYLIRRKHEKSN